MTEDARPRTLLGWVAPLALVSAAIGAHWMLNVPRGPLPPPVPAAKDPAKPKPDPKALGDDDDKDKDDEVEPFTTPRSQNLLVQQWERYDAVDFKKEATFDAWSVAHRPLVNQIVSAARARTFAEVSPPPSITVSGVECHTVRCRFNLASAKAEDLERVIAALQGLQLHGATLWHSFKADPITEEPAKRPGGAVRQKTTVLVAFANDLPVVDEIKLADGNPLRPPPPPAPALLPGAGGPTRAPGGPTALQPGAPRPSTAPGPLSGVPGGPGKSTKG